MDNEYVAKIHGIYAFLGLNVTKIVRFCLHHESILHQIRKSVLSDLFRKFSRMQNLRRGMENGKTVMENGKTVMEFRFAKTGGTLLSRLPPRLKTWKI